MVLVETVVPHTVQRSSMCPSAFGVAGVVTVLQLWPVAGMGSDSVNSIPQTEHTVAPVCPGVVQVAGVSCSVMGEWPSAEMTSDSARVSPQTEQRVEEVRPSSVQVAGISS